MNDRRDRLRCHSSAAWIPGSGAPADLTWQRPPAGPRRLSRRIAFAAAALQLVVWTGGCGSSTPVLSTVPASGVVTLDGAPAEHAVVSFLPIEGTAGYGSSATTDAQGRYVMRTSVRKAGLTGQGATVVDGIPPGHYRVLVSRRLHPDGSPMRPDETPIESPAVETIAPAFSDANAGSLRVDVPSSGGTFDLKVKGVRKK